MFRVVLADGSIQELPSVTKTAVEENCLICYDQRGAIVGQYGPRDVIAYGDDGSILALVESGYTLEHEPDGAVPTDEEPASSA